MPTMHQNTLVAEPLPDPLGELTVLPRPLAGFEGPTSREGERKGRKERGKEREEKGKGRGGEGRVGLAVVPPTTDSFRRLRLYDYKADLHGIGSIII